MLNSVSNDQAYIDALMAKLPNVQEKQEYALKKGDSLWSLAKKCLNDKNASNAKTANYMLLIAKLNKLDTVEKMNGLKVGQKIYLPQNSVKADKKTKVSVKKVRNDAEKSYLKAIDTVNENKNLKLEKANMTYGQCYHLYKQNIDKNGYPENKKWILSFDLNSKGEINTVSMDDVKQNVNTFGYDYDVDKNGNIIEGKYPYSVKGKLTKDENNMLRSKLIKLVGEYNKK